jgi:hypothetical protein
MELLFRRVRPDEVEQELTQKDQFNTDRVPLAATLVRESHQNSTDASRDSGPVRIRIATHASTGSAEFWSGLFKPLESHLNACGFDIDDIDFGRPRFLVIEDFETTGLTGDFNSKDDRNFSDFWRRVGRSHKQGGKGGSWGLGKLVFPVASQVRTFFGLTVREDDAKQIPLLMGQAVLTTHTIGAVDYAPHGFFAIPSTNGFQLPVTAPAFTDRFCQAVGFTRNREPGLSIAIPFPQEGLTPDKLIPLVIENYFFPILTGQLAVDCGEQIINAKTFDAVAATCTGGQSIDSHLIGFIRDMDKAKQGIPDFTLPERWAARDLDQVIPEDELQTLRTSYDAGNLVHVCAPMTLRPKDGSDGSGWFDLFLRRAPDDVPGRALFIRGSLTVPNEETNFRNRKCFAALVARGGPISRFLRDAENPAHTSWNGNAEKLARNWRAPAERLREIRHSLRQLHDLLDRGVRREDSDALKFLINIRDVGADKSTSRPNPTVRPVIMPDLEGGQRFYDIAARKGGFVLRAGPDLTQHALPMHIQVQAAYDLATGNPFKKFSSYDFDFRQASGIEIKASGADHLTSGANRLIVTVTKPDFFVEVTGFDPHRDLVVGAVEVGT